MELGFASKHLIGIKMKRKKEHLIPFDKTKRIIYLNQRGKQSTPKSVYVWSVLGILCLIYCVSIALFMGFGTTFFLIWGAMALGCFGLAFLLAHPQWVKRIPKALRIIIIAIFCVGMVLFLGVEGLILSKFGAKPEAGADYMIVLGAQWKSNGPSDVLRRRLDKAIDYLQDNPETVVIVTGAQGANESITEAQGMKQYLIEHGIQEERIVAEEKATNTKENLLYSSEYLNKQENSVVLVTNNFHMFRALAIAQNQGYEKIEGLAASSYPGMIPNNLLREALGLVKEVLVGNI